MKIQYFDFKSCDDIFNYGEQSEKEFCKLYIGTRENNLAEKMFAQNNEEVDYDDIYLKSIMKNELLIANPLKEYTEIEKG